MLQGPCSSFTDHAHPLNSPTSCGSGSLNVHTPGNAWGGGGGDPDLPQTARLHLPAPHQGPGCPPPLACQAPSRCCTASVHRKTPPACGPGTYPLRLTGVSRLWGRGPGHQQPAGHVPGPAPPTKPGPAHPGFSPHLERFLGQSSARGLRGRGSRSLARSGGGTCEGELARVSESPGAVEVGYTVAWQLARLGAGLIKGRTIFRTIARVN